VQGEEGNEGRQAGEDEERPLGHERTLPGLRHRPLPHHGLLNSRAQALLAAKAALDKQAEDVVVLQVRALTTVADYFVIGTGTSARQIDALREHIETVLRQSGAQVWHVEGTAAPAASSERADTPTWVLMDCGDVVVHLFDPRARAFYRLEELWADAPRVACEAGVPHH
jgi:ribosome-associated protein